MAKKRGPGGPKVNGKSGTKMTRKEAKTLKKDMKAVGHGSGKMSVRKIKKHGRKSSF